MAAPKPKDEPVALTGLIVAVVIAGISLVTAFGLKVTPEQAAAIIGIVSAIVALAGALFARSKVMPMSRAKHAADE